MCSCEGRVTMLGRTGPFFCVFAGFAGGLSGESSSDMWLDWPMWCDCTSALQLSSAFPRPATTMPSSPESTVAPAWLPPVALPDEVLFAPVLLSLTVRVGARGRFTREMRSPMIVAVWRRPGRRGRSSRPEDDLWRSAGPLPLRIEDCGRPGHLQRDRTRGYSAICLRFRAVGAIFRLLSTLITP